ncbi:MAG TPA: YbaY family lipoprotein [Gemmatimonadales bacterium]|nr:YbaY family lipoprotein [Gemmatimonadales bacterium]
MLGEGLERRPPEQSMKGAVRGTASYRERMALPPGAVLEVSLQDVSKADATAEVIGQARIENPGNPPFRFEIPYDPSRIDPRHRYAVRAQILVDGKPFFVTDRHYGVLTEGMGNEVDVMLRKAVASPAGAAKSPENIYWKLVQLGNTAITTSGKAEPHLMLSSETRRVSGSGGCNRLMGGYELSGGRLKFGQMAATRMACLEGMETEKAFLDALGRVTGWGMTGHQLELVDASGGVVARFEARQPE